MGVSGCRVRKSRLWRVGVLGLRESGASRVWSIGCGLQGPLGPTGWEGSLAWPSFLEEPSTGPTATHSWTCKDSEQGLHVPMWTCFEVLLYFLGRVIMGSLAMALFGPDSNLTHSMVLHVLPSCTWLGPTDARRVPAKPAPLEALCLCKGSCEAVLDAMQSQRGD